MSICEHAEDVPIRAWRAAGLSAPSILRWKIFTLPETLIERIAGRLVEPDRETVAEALVDLLGT